MTTSYRVIVVFLAILRLICDNIALQPDAGNGLLTYSRDELLLHRASLWSNIKPAVDLPSELKPRKRGKRGGIRSRVRRRPFRPPLPTVIMANVRSLRNTMDLLHARSRYQKTFKDVCIIALSETWLDESVPDSEVSLDNFTIIRADRTRDSGKRRCGGVCLYINDRWCNNIKVHRKMCTPNLELLTVSLRPFYLPREFPTVVISCVYVVPEANINIAAEMIAEDANAMLAKYPGAPLFILGDFNSCRLDRVLPSLQQYVDIPTRRGNILDLCYGNVSDAFRASSHPPLGRADHNIICLLPLYRQELKRHKPQRHSALQWTEDAITQLQGSLACTDWNIFDGNLNDRASVITDYINFCISSTIPTKIMKIYPSKPWITPQIKQSLKEKHKSFRHKDWAGLEAANRDLRNEVLKAKLDYKNKLETEFSTMNTKQAFQKVKALTGCEPKSTCTVSDPETFTKDLNIFYTRFDNQDFSSECQALLRTLPPPDPEAPDPFTEEEVRRQLSSCKPGKAAGPDGIPARVLKTCAMELTPILHSLFCQSYRTATIPTLWKTATIIPVPKKPRPSELNHYRPIALTSIIMKCLEKLLLNIILPLVTPHLDPLQFAYKAKRGTEDAVACLLHLLLQHLDRTGRQGKEYIFNFARILFVDFSSAFNSLQKHLLIQKLHHLNIPPQLIHLTHNFLTDRLQAVRVGSTTSPMLTINTGVPQGCVLSPFLYILYTNDCISKSPITSYIKYSDDTAILTLLSDDNQSTLDYHNTVSVFTKWCTDNHLQINVNKTKELLISPPSPQPPTIINTQTVETVDTFKYLGITLDNKLSFDQHTTDIQKRSQQRLSAIRKLKGLYVAPHLLLLLYQSIVQPILLYCSTCFFTMLSVTNQVKLTRITNTAAKIIGLPTPNLTDLNNKSISRIAYSIAQDPTHPLNKYFTLLPSGRRYRTLKFNRARFKKSLVPAAIEVLNNRPR